MKIDKVKSKFSNQTVGTWLKKMPNELAIDAIGLWQIIPSGIHSYGFSGDDLEEFTRRALSAVLARGAVPVMGSNDPRIGWRHAKEYGSTNEIIIDKIVQEWLCDAEREPHVEDVWFIMPQHVNTW